MKRVLGKSQRAAAAFQALSQSQKNHDVEWITEAKTDLIGDKRLATTVEWIADGKSRNGKYERTKRR